MKGILTITGNCNAYTKGSNGGALEVDGGCVIKTNSIQQIKTNQQIFEIFGVESLPRFTKLHFHGRYNWI
jgi:hypothetical protein